MTPQSTDNRRNTNQGCDPSPVAHAILNRVIFANVGDKVQFRDGTDSVQFSDSPGDICFGNIFEHLETEGALIRDENSSNVFTRGSSDYLDALLAEAPHVIQSLRIDTRRHLLTSIDISTVEGKLERLEGELWCAMATLALEKRAIDLCEHAPAIAKEYLEGVQEGRSPETLPRFAHRVVFDRIREASGSDDVISSRVLNELSAILAVTDAELGSMPDQAIVSPGSLFRLTKFSTKRIGDFFDEARRLNPSRDLNRLIFELTSNETLSIIDLRECEEQANSFQITISKNAISVSERTRVTMNIDASSGMIQSFSADSRQTPLEHMPVDTPRSEISLLLMDLLDMHLKISDSVTCCNDSGLSFKIVPAIWESEG